MTVVDNSSNPEVAEVARRYGAGYVDPGTNLGFAAGVNRALEMLAVESVDALLLNPDARVSPEVVHALHLALQADPGLACVGPAQRWPGSEAQASSVWPWHTPARAWAEALGLARRPPAKFFLSGAVLLLRGTALADVGRFDERFFLYAEDEDWQRRAIGHGWRIAHHPEISAVHASGSTETEAERLRLRLHAATERYVRKWHGTLGWQSYRLAVVVGQTLRGITRGGWRGRSARALARLYLAGPDRSAVRAGAVPPGSPRPVGP